MRRGFQLRLRCLKVADTNLEERFPAEVEVFEGGGDAHWVVYLLLVGLLSCFWRPYVPHQYRATIGQ